MIFARKMLIIICRKENQGDFFFREFNLKGRNTFKENIAGLFVRCVTLLSHSLSRCIRVGLLLGCKFVLKSR